MQVRTLIPKVERLIHNNGMESELLVLTGTVAINYQGRQYNIPVEVYVSEPYPDAPPRCYVRPTKDMDIKMGHRHVDREVCVFVGIVATFRLIITIIIIIILCVCHVLLLTSHFFVFYKNGHPCSSSS